MAALLQRELDRLKRHALDVATRVEDAVQTAWEAFAERDPVLGRTVVRQDAEIDAKEVDVEEECLKILALHQPVAVDLRFIVAVIKFNSDLERIGDLAADLAERAVWLSDRAPLPVPDQLPRMASAVQAMLRQALDSLVNLDAEAARAVCRADDEVDAGHREMYDIVQTLVSEHPERIRELIQLLSVSRYLERIADHATNIAEDVIYLVQGDIVRHQPDESGGA